MHINENGTENSYATKDIFFKNDMYLNFTV